MHFATMHLNVIKPQGEMQPDDYNKNAMGLDLSIARPQEKVELMEETQRVVTTDFLKFGHQLKKREELKLVKERVEVLLAREKVREVEKARLSEKA